MELFEAGRYGEGRKSATDSVTDGVIDSWLRRQVTFDRPSPRSELAGKKRYMTPLWVFGSREPEEEEEEEIFKYHPSPHTTTGIKLRPESIVPHHHEIKHKIRTIFTLLTFREQRVLIQFWSPLFVGKHWLLTTLDQPFGLGVVDEGLCYYRRGSELNPFIMEDEYKEEDLSPPARVFKRGLPEWTSDVTNYLPRYYPNQDLVVRCNLHGSLVLPVFEDRTRSCVGVLELVTSSEHLDFGYEVNEVHKALQAANLTSPPLFDHPASYVANEGRQLVLDKIFSILKALCDTYKLPLAQTWALSSFSSFVAHEKILDKSCSSFNTKCIGKVCMSTTYLPFYIGDLGMWNFREACQEQHLEKARGVVGRSLLSYGSYVCGDVTKLSEDEYPLVHIARMSGLASCFAIYLRSVEGGDDYVLEFFLPFGIKEGRNLSNFVQTLKKHVELSSEFELGDTMFTELVGQSVRDGELSFKKEPDIVPTSTITEDTTLPKSKSSLGGVEQLDSANSNSEIMGGLNPIVDCRNVLNQCSVGKGYSKKCDKVNTVKEKIVREAVSRIDVVGAGEIYDVPSFPNVNMQKMNDIYASVVENDDSLKQSRKRKMDSLTLEAIQQHFRMPIGDAAMSLGVSRSTLKRFCREHDIPSWPLPQSNKKIACTQLSEKSWSVQSNVPFGIANAVFLLTRIKSWRCRSNHCGHSGRWWICRKHGHFVSNQMLSKGVYDAFSSRNLDHLLSLALHEESFSSKQPKEIYYSTGTVIPFSLSSKVHFGIYHAALLLLGLRRWRRQILVKNGSFSGSWHLTKVRYGDYLTEVSRVSHAVLAPASSKGSVANISDAVPSVTIKATFKDNMIKFRFALSDGLLELEDQVAQRIKLKNKSFRLKYMDEDNDLILIACQADLQSLLVSLGTSNSNSTIKLFVQPHHS